MNLPVPQGSPLDVVNEIDAKIKSVQHQSLDISFNELADMISTGELDISPDYQRLFQWSEGARSRFIESLLLEMPVPPIFVVEEDDGRKLLIDGLQRISSYLHFRGMLEAPHMGVKKDDFLVLQDCDILASLNGKTFNDFPLAAQIKLKRAFVRVEVIRKGSDPRFKYFMFKRLNSGGMALTSQQLRNCTIRLLGPQFNDFIITLSKHEDFSTCISSISDEARMASYDQELVLRFFAFKNNRSGFKHDISDFLTEFMEAVSDPENPLPFDYTAEETIFDKTFKCLALALGGEAFSRASRDRSKLIQGFGIYHFEAISLGIQSVLDKINADDPNDIIKLKTALMSLKFDPSFIDQTTGGGKNSPGPLNARISLAESFLTNAL